MKNRDGVSLEVALAWLSPYAEGQKAHEESVHSMVTFDHNRKKAGVKGYSGMWEQKNGAIFYNLAARLGSRWEGLANRLGKAQPWVLLALPLGNVSN